MFQPICIAVVLAFAQDAADFPTPELNSETIVAEAPSPETAESVREAPSEPTPAFVPFTGRVKGRNVRVRLHPHYDGAILMECGKESLFSVVGEQGDFYAIVPPESYMAYIFRGFVYDNVIEGSHVNVRTQPSLDAPILTQLNSGDRVETIDRESHGKWTSIKPPRGITFYIAKDYVDKIPERSAEPEVVAQAEVVQAKEEIAPQEEPEQPTVALSELMQAWQPIEEGLYAFWAHANDHRPLDDFYEEQKLTAETVRGVIEPYNSTLKNRPGDFLLRVKDAIVACVYSTKVDLQSLEGKEVTLLVSPRPNRNFAFDAYFVLEVES